MPKKAKKLHPEFHNIPIFLGAPRARYFSTSEADIPVPSDHHQHHHYSSVKDDIDLHWNDDSRGSCSEMIQNKPLEKAQTMEKLPDAIELHDLSVDTISEIDEARSK
uniref:Uncharacterized protein n=1 Tax=Panagrolaimus superbus TaxID=310955 RepID=A0A914Y9B8_9BILA